MSKGFQNSVVLTQDSPGVRTSSFIIVSNHSVIFFFQHCSLAAPSVCTQKYIRDYFIDGTLPEPNTICLPVKAPFSTIADQTLLATMTAEEQEIYAAVSALSHDSGIHVASIDVKNSNAGTKRCAGM